MSAPASFVNLKSPEMRWLEMPKRKLGYENLQVLWKSSNPVLADDLDGLNTNVPSASNNGSQLSPFGNTGADQGLSDATPSALFTDAQSIHGIHGRPFSIHSYLPVYDNSHLEPLIDDKPISETDRALLRAIETDSKGDKPEGALAILTSRTDANIREQFFSGAPPAELSRRYGTDLRRFQSRWSLDSTVAGDDDGEETTDDEEEGTVGNDGDETTDVEDVVTTVDGTTTVIARVTEQRVQAPVRPSLRRMTRTVDGYTLLPTVCWLSRGFLGANAEPGMDHATRIATFKAIIEVSINERWPF